MRSIGLTGGIASGKTTVSAILADLGALIIDADRLGHRAYEPGGDTFRLVVKAFGPDIVAADGTIDRAALGARVFADPRQMMRLTEMVWPAIGALAQEELATEAATGVEVAIVEAAVLFEAGWEALVDEVWVVSVPPLVARERLMRRNGLSAAEAEARIASQLSNAEREARADIILSTDCPLAQVRGRVEEAWRGLQARIALVPQAASSERSAL